MNGNYEYIDLSYLKEASGGNGSFIKEMILLFLKQTPDYLEQLKANYGESDWENFRKIMHKLKPTVTMMGIKKGEELIKKIEVRVKGQTELETVGPDLLQLETICVRSFDELNHQMASL